MSALLQALAAGLFLWTALQPTSAPSWPRELAWGLAVLAASFVLQWAGW